VRSDLEDHSCNMFEGLVAQVVGLANHTTFGSTIVGSHAVDSEDTAEADTAAADVEEVGFGANTEAGNVEEDTFVGVLEVDIAVGSLAVGTAVVDAPAEDTAVRAAAEGTGAADIHCYGCMTGTAGTAVEFELADSAVAVAVGFADTAEADSVETAGIVGAADTGELAGTAAAPASLVLPSFTARWNFQYSQ